MRCIGEMVRKLCARLEVVGLNSHDRAHTFTHEKFALLMTCFVIFIFHFS
jgi:hypothetical protein